MCSVRSSLYASLSRSLGHLTEPWSAEAGGAVHTRPAHLTLV